jgi:hypothetical protein
VDLDVNNTEAADAVLIVADLCMYLRLWVGLASISHSVD